MTVGVGTLSAELTVKDRVPLCTVLPLESVTDTLTEELPVALGEQVMVAELDAVHPVGRPVHVYVL